MLGKCRCGVHFWQKPDVRKILYIGQIVVVGKPEISIHARYRMPEFIGKSYKLKNERELGTSLRVGFDHELRICFLQVWIPLKLFANVRLKLLSEPLT